MSLTSQFLIYVTAFRLAIITAGIVSMVLGYKLFIRGIYPNGEAESSIDVRAIGSGFSLRNAAPGTSFAIFGVALITAMLIQGSPQFTYQMMQKAAGAQAPITSTTLEMRGGATADVFNTLVEKGLAYEQAGDTPHAVEAYQQALERLATPLNQLAWIYYQQSKTDQALPLARMAAQLDPENPKILDTLAQVLARHGDHAEAVQWMQKAAVIDPQYRSKVAELKESPH